jgi:cold shock CspA family protein
MTDAVAAKESATIKNVRDSYLFVTTEAGVDVFCHTTDFVDGNFAKAQKGDKVLLDVTAGSKGPRGSNIELLGSEAS